MKKILLFVYPTFAEFEITVATALLKKKYEIITAGLTKEMIISETGLQVQPHIELSEVRVEEYEGIIIPGGDEIHMKEAKLLFSVIRQFSGARKISGSDLCWTVCVSKGRFTKRNLLYSDHRLSKIRLFSSRKFCVYRSCTARKYYYSTRTCICAIWTSDCLLFWSSE